VSASASPPSRPDRATRRTLVVLLLVGLAPVLASYGFYYFAPRAAQANYGELLPTRPAAAIEGALPDGKAFHLADLRGRWVIVAVAPGRCDEACARLLYATRQARTMQGREQERVVRVWLVSDGVAPSPGIVADHPGLVVVLKSPGAFRAPPEAKGRITLIDPLGNQVLAWPSDPDIKGVARDLGRVLKASQIG
jgi:hypothetical protein